MIFCIIITCRPFYICADFHLLLGSLGNWTDLNKFNLRYTEHVSWAVCDDIVCMFNGRLLQKGGAMQEKAWHANMEVWDQQLTTYHWARTTETGIQSSFKYFTVDQRSYFQNMQSLHSLSAENKIYKLFLY